MTTRRHAFRALLQVGLLALSAALVVRMLVGADLRRVGEILASSGWSAVLVLIPYVAAVGVDTIGWSILLAGLGHRLGLPGLLRLRLSTEAVLLSAPLGTVGAESLKAYLLERRFAVPVPDSIASIGAKKTLLTLALGVYLAGSAVVGAPYLERASLALLGRPGLPAVVFVTGVALVILALLLFASLGGGAVAHRLHALLAAVPIPAVRRWIAARQRRFQDVDRQLGRLAADRPRLLAATLTFLAGWLVEAGESFVLLQIIGAQISFPQLLAFEATVALIRSLAFFAPAGIGVQDASYLGFFAAVGVPHAANVGAAFLVLKRGKELFWIVTGYLLLVSQKTAPPRPPGDRPRVLFICGTIHQSRQMAQIRAALGDAVDGWFTPYFCDGYLVVLRAFRFLEMTIAGLRLSRRCRAWLDAHGLPVDERGRNGGYDLVVTCSDILVPRAIRGVPLVAVQEGMTDPENVFFRLYRRFPWLVPRWLPGTSTTGMSGRYAKMCVASPGYRDYFVARKGADPARLEVTGIPNLDDCDRFRDNDFPHRGYVLVCTSDGRETFRFEDRAAFLRKAVAIAAGRPMIFKLHPNEKVERATREIAEACPGALVYTSGSAEEMIANCDVLVCQYSTTVYVGLALGKEVHSFFDVDELRRLVPIQNGGTSALAIADVCRRLLVAEAPARESTLPALVRAEEVAT